MKAFVAASLALTFASPATPAGPETPTPLLEPGKTVVRPLAHGETHRYRIDLAAGAYLSAAVQPRGIGVVVTLSRPDGSLLTSIDAARGGPGSQALTVVASAAGAYSVEVRPLEKNPSPGEYGITVEELRPAGAREQGLLDGQALFADALRAKSQGTATSLPEAAERFQKALAIFRQEGARWWELHAAHELCDVHALLSQNQQALEDSRQLAALAEGLGADRLKARALHLRGAVQKALGDAAALQSYLDALAIWARVDDTKAESSTLDDVAVVYSDRGEKEKALNHYLKALALRRAAGDQAGESETLHDIGVYYYDLGEYERAREYYEQSLAFRSVHHNLRSRGATLSMLGQAYIALGQPQKGLETALQALSARRESGDRRGEGGALARVGLAYEAVGQADKATEYLRLALDVLHAIPDPQGESDVLRVLARYHLQAGRKEQARELYKQSLALAQSLGERQRTMLGLYLLATVERALGEHELARQHNEAALALTELFRASLPDHQLRGSALAMAQEYYDFHVDLLMQTRPREPGWPLVEAFEIDERSRARSFLELLTESSGRDLRERAQGGPVERDRELEGRLDAAAERQLRLLAGPHTPEQAASVTREIQDLLREHDLVEAQLRLSNPGSAVFRQPQPLSLSEIQRQVLDDRTVLLQYRLGAERSYLWTVTRDAIDAYELPKAAEIEAAARRWHELLSGGPPAPAAGSDELGKQAAALTKMLLSPIAGHLRNRRLLIVADGALQYVPFAALPSPARPDTPLVVDHEVLSAPSASMVAVLRRQLAARAPAQKTLAVLADPVFDAEDERIGPGPKLAATVVAPTAPARARDITRSASEVGLRDGAISRLPFTRREAEAILALVPAGQRMQALDFAASRATATSPELAQYRYVHFATHGFANSAHPELSGIVLSLVDPQGREQSGFLAASQVFDLKLPAELVVLSGCRTALGKEIKGEGLLGLTRAFMSAGAGRVVASLWKVDDAATAELMKTMYERILRDGERPAQALRSAQITMWQTKRWSAPYYWAAFVIQGEWN